MERTVISHDIGLAKARIRFEHNDVVVEEDFDLANVVPSTKYVFEQMGMTFDEIYQSVAMDKLTTIIQSQIDQGLIKNPPPVETPPYTPPPEDEDSSEEEEEVVEEEPTESESDLEEEPTEENTNPDP